MDKKRFNELSERFGALKVAVIGDLMLDVYLFGQVTRISPEAPVPVVQVAKRQYCPGGAANVIRNIATLGGQCLAFGIVGSDEDGETLKAEIAAYNVSVNGVAIDADRRTTVKERVVCGNQQLLRVDYESVVPVADKIREKLVNELVELIENRAIDALIFEDYAKGMLSSEMVQALVESARRNGIITTLDPNPRGLLSPVKGITVMKPNRQEAAQMAGCSADSPAQLEGVASRLLGSWAPEQLLISLAAQGMGIWQLDGSRTVIPTRAREVYDVSGAGDTVIAAYTMALAAGATALEAAEVANCAAGVVVAKVGTATVNCQEIAKALEEF